MLLRAASCFPRRFRSVATLAFLLVVAATVAAPTACGGGASPSAPSPVSALAPLTGSTRDGTTDAPLSAVTVRIDGVGEAVSDTAGQFEIMAPVPQQARTVVVSSPLVVTRETRVFAPGPDASLTLIPTSFDLAAFNELFRSGGSLRRWTTRPAVMVADRVLRFTNVSDLEYVATGSSLTDGDVQSIVQDLIWGLPQLTANAYATFADTTRLSPTEGERVSVRRSGAIVVARYEGLQDATGHWGYGRWATDSSGSVASGILMLDARFDRSNSRYTRSLRVHEMGHTLGYGHVTVRTSFMNSSAVTLPTEFDLKAVRLAFQRPPLNRPPDTDPAPFTANLQTGELRWSGLP